MLEQIKTLEIRPPRQLDDSIPKELERICLTALSKRASDRYTTALDMAEDLRCWLRRDSAEGRADARDEAAGASSADHAGIAPEWNSPARDATRAADAPVVVHGASADGALKQLFISYASEDREQAFRLCFQLERQGIGCWIAPRDVAPGEKYGESIIRAIEATSTTVLLLSTHANASGFVANEVERATSKRKRVIPVRLEDVRPAPSLDLFLSAVQWLDAWTMPIEQVASQVAQVVRPAAPLHEAQPGKVVPKGLRSFDAQDADFFLDLLAGAGPRRAARKHSFLEIPRRRDRSRTDVPRGPDLRAVGLRKVVAGQGRPAAAACFFGDIRLHRGDRRPRQRVGRHRAPLAPRLARRCPKVATDLDLPQTIAALRRGRGLPPGRKVLIVLDQFEQWLHSKQSYADAELVEALRHCDGERVQCIVMVRDDFWLAVNRFMEALEIRLVDGANSRMVNLFDYRHARKVLAAMGQAFGAIPETKRDSEQDAFLDQAVAGLAQEGKVSPVRLALFAEMVKGKPWTPASLRKIGGAEGVGVAFLEETFSSPSAPPHHRLHQKTAQAVLAALLPDGGGDIKGHLRSRTKLLAALNDSGVRITPAQFDEVMAMLDSEPPPGNARGRGDGGRGGDCPDFCVSKNGTVPFGARNGLDTGEPSAGAAAPAAQTVAREKSYQLTHDYLVPSLRTWLTRKQRATCRGRAELRLADITPYWTAKQENRRLPSLLEFARIRFYTSPRTWNDAQRRMIKAAARMYALRTVSVLVLAVVIAVGAREPVWPLPGRRVRKQLYGAELDNVPAIVHELGRYWTWANAWLADDIKTVTASGDEERHLRASLALLPNDDGQIDYLYQPIGAGPSSIGAICAALYPRKEQIPDRLWSIVRLPPDRSTTDSDHACWPRLPRLRSMHLLIRSGIRPCPAWRRPLPGLARTSPTTGRRTWAAFATNRYSR